MKSMTLSMSRTLPLAVVVRRRPVSLELRRVRAAVFASRRHQRRLQTIIDAIGDRLHGAPAAVECGHHLLFPHAPMLEVADEQRARVVDARAVARKQLPGS